MIPPMYETNPPSGSLVVASARADDGAADTVPHSLPEAEPSSNNGNGVSPASPIQPSWIRWLIEGLRGGFFLSPRVAGVSPGAIQVLWITAIGLLLPLYLERLEIKGPADFAAAQWLATWWSTAPLLWLGWWAMRRRPISQPLPLLLLSASPTKGQTEFAPAKLTGLAAWYILTVGAYLPPALLMGTLSILATRGILPLQSASAVSAFWAIQWVLLGWGVLALIVLSGRFIRSVPRTLGFAAGLIILVAVSTSQLHVRSWYGAEVASRGANQTDARAEGEAGSETPERPAFQLSQQIFEDQQALWQTTVNQLAPQRPGVVDVYGLVFAPYAAEDVFRRESTMVANLLRSRFDAEGRVLQLLNHAETSASLPWATPQNLDRAIAALAARMDRENDLLMVYMTSHGGGNFHLAANHEPLEVEPISPQMLRESLDRAGIKNRVIAISACYSGGWVAPLATPSTLVMTAADATHTSFGCGHKSPMTFFGRAVFDEELRKTHSFEQAFINAVPVIKRREEEGGKDDGFSNPQISVGAEIAPVLKALEQRLAQ